MGDSRPGEEERGVREDNSEGMKIIKIKNCNFCPHYVHKFFMDISKNNKTTRFSKDMCHYLIPHIIGTNEKYNPLILIEIPKWCPLEDYK